MDGDLSLTADGSVLGFTAGSPTPAPTGWRTYGSCLPARRSGCWAASAPGGRNFAEVSFTPDAAGRHLLIYGYFRPGHLEEMNLSSGHLVPVTTAQPPVMDGHRRAPPGEQTTALVRPLKVTGLLRTTAKAAPTMEPNLSASRPSPRGPCTRSTKLSAARHAPHRLPRRGSAQGRDLLQTRAERAVRAASAR